MLRLWNMSLGICLWSENCKVFLDFKIQFLHVFHIELIFFDFLLILSKYFIKKMCVLVFLWDLILHKNLIITVWENAGYRQTFAYISLSYAYYTSLSYAGEPKPLLDEGYLQTPAFTALQLPSGGGTHQPWLNPGCLSHTSPAGGITKPQVHMVHC